MNKTKITKAAIKNAKWNEELEIIRLIQSLHIPFINNAGNPPPSFHLTFHLPTPILAIVILLVWC